MLSGRTDSGDNPFPRAKRFSAREVEVRVAISPRKEGVGHDDCGPSRDVTPAAMLTHQASNNCRHASHRKNCKGTYQGTFAASSLQGHRTIRNPCLAAHDFTVCTLGNPGNLQTWS